MLVCRTYGCLPESPIFLNDATFSLCAIRLLNACPMDPPSPELEPGSTDPQQAGTIDLIRFFTGIKPARSGIFPKRTPSPKVCKLCAYVCLFLIDSAFLQQAAQNMALIHSPMVWLIISIEQLLEMRLSEDISTKYTLRCMIQCR
jgi:hypothetical protein